MKLWTLQKRSKWLSNRGKIIILFPKKIFIPHKKLRKYFFLIHFDIFLFTLVLFFSTLTFFYFFTNLHIMLITSPIYGIVKYFVINCNIVNRSVFKCKSKKIINFDLDYKDFRDVNGLILSEF